MNFLSGRNLALKLLAVFCLSTAFMLPAASTAWGEPLVKRPRGDYHRLKRQFEDQVRKTEDPKITVCLSAETAALAWLLAAANLAEVEDSLKWLNKAAEFENARAASQNWETRHLAALEFYYQSLVEIIPLLSAKSGQQVLLTELDDIVNETEGQFVLLEGKPDSTLEKRVILSGAVTGLMSNMVRAVGGGSMEQPVQNILSRVVAKADYISKRPDIHYRAKLSQLYANNIQGLTALVFLLGQNAGPPLSGELAEVHGNLLRQIDGLNLPDVTSLTWVAQAQAALPLAYWLATHY